MTATAAAQEPAHDYREIDLKLIDEGDNTRTSYDKAPLEELAASIKAIGVSTAVLLRPKGKRFELVYGYRRRRAAELAGLTAIPARVRELSDLEVLEHQLVENGQRQDVHPLQEAEAYQKLHTDHGKSVEEIAAKIGKSASHVRARLKLCGLCNAARAFFVAGKMSASVAQLVARIPDAKLQAKAAQEVCASRYDNAPMPQQQAAEHIQRNYMLRLELAPFDTAAEQLVEGCGACVSCPKRTGNQRELFADVKSADVCTDPPCYDRKAAAGWKLMAADAKARGYAVLPEAEAKKLFPYPGSPGHLSSNGFVSLTDTCQEDPKRRSYGKLIGSSPDALTLVRAPDGSVHKLLPRAGLKKAIKDAGHDFWKKEKKAPASPKAKAKLAELNQEREIIERLSEEITADLIDKLERHEPSAGQWAELATVVVERCAISIEMLKRHGIAVDPKKYSYYSKERKELIARLPKLTIGQLRSFVLELTILEDCGSYGGRLSPEIERLAKAFGTDTKAIRKVLIASAAQKKKEQASAEDKALAPSKVMGGKPAKKKPAAKKR